ncbi:Cell wall-associated hydrolase, NlpC family [Franzmannia pantelleriensis]|uniref:Cell wall-associated hydrolase, NlpC family n=1 Tax=Franzmannia pantelleriensis TaxID=48727 RepID=A0A1G9KN09_9GAMM|nr:C40 family peptidase [Halomonas pantelleriensis]SDL50785.1 Cell wall-associated hydrolase, NlpC family [Halomonas pantelleriensis]
MTTPYAFTHWRILPLCWALLLLALLSGCASRDIATRDAPVAATGLSIERAMILANAQQALGTPYRFGGNTREGLDCSGLVEMAYRAAGIRVPRTADDQFRQLPQVDEARPGDLLFFGSGRKATHVGIYQGDRQMIHAPGRGREVVSVPLDIDYWQNRFLGAAGPAP